MLQKKLNHMRRLLIGMNTNLTENPTRPMTSNPMRVAYPMVFNSFLLVLY